MYALNSINNYDSLIIKKEACQNDKASYYFTLYNSSNYSAYKDNSRYS